MSRHLRLLAVVLSLFVLMTSQGQAAKRVALVVGNDDYPKLAADEQLKKAINDAQAMAGKLRELGYTVITGENADFRQFYGLWEAFSAAVAPGDEVAIFYSGHGLEIRGQNFLVPVDAVPPKSGEQTAFRKQLIDLGELAEVLKEERQPRVALFIIDACRNNPFRSADGTRAIGGAKGLVMIEPPKGTFMMFSAGSGELALDRLSDADADPNSIYTRKLLPLLGQKGLTIQDVAQKVRAEVSALARTALNHDQNPGYRDELLGERGPLCLAGCEGAGEHAKPVELATPSSEAAASDVAALAAQVKLLQQELARQKQMAEQVANEQAVILNRLPDGVSMGVAAETKARVGTEGDSAKMKDLTIAERIRQALENGQSDSSTGSREEQEEALLISPAGNPFDQFDDEVNCGQHLVNLGTGADARDVCLKPGDTFRECKLCPDMVLIPSGQFTMGSPESEEGRYEDERQHEVKIAQRFAAGRFEVTFAEWDACANAGGCLLRPEAPWGRGRQPVVNVSWDDAQEYLGWLSKQTGQTYRLLTEAEWEYAARAGTRTRYFWGNEFDESKTKNNGSSTVEVGTYPLNAFGLHDMHGNVSEWVEDCYENDYSDAPEVGSVDGIHPVCVFSIRRGGSWRSYPKGLRAAFRSALEPHSRDDSTGFRVARSLNP